MSAVEDVVQFTSQPRRQRGPWGKLATGISLVLLIIVSVASLLPFAWLFRSALMTSGQIFAMPPEWLPQPFVWDNFSGALQSQPFALYLVNTLTIVAIVVPGALLSTSAAAFAFSRLRWPGRRVVFALVMSSLLLPWAVTLVPTFIMWQTLGFTNTIGPLTIPAWFAAGAGYNIFLLRQFFSQIPIEYDHAIYVDGGTPWTVYWRIMLPINRGPLTLVGVFTIIATWNDLIGPLIYLNSPEKFTITQGLAAFQGIYVSQWGYLMAATIIAILPLIVLFVFAQRAITEGVTLTGIKG